MLQVRVIVGEVFAEEKADQANRIGPDAYRIGGCGLACMKLSAIPHEDQSSGACAWLLIADVGAGREMRALRC